MSDAQLVKILGPWEGGRPRAIAVLILGAVCAFYGASRFPRAIRATQNAPD